MELHALGNVIALFIRKSRCKEDTMTSEASKLEMSVKHDRLVKEETTEIGSVCVHN